MTKQINSNGTVFEVSDEEVEHYQEMASSIREGKFEYDPYIDEIEVPIQVKELDSEDLNTLKLMKISNELEHIRFKLDNHVIKLGISNLFLVFTLAFSLLANLILILKLFGAKI